MHTYLDMFIISCIYTGIHVFRKRKLCMLQYIHTFRHSYIYIDINIHIEIKTHLFYIEIVRNRYRCINTKRNKKRYTQIHLYLYTNKHKVMYTFIDKYIQI